MEWVSNPIDKKQGTIHVCTEFQDLNKACPKDNYPTPFIDQIIDACAGSEVFSFMDGFSRYNQIQIKLEDQHKTAFISPWGTFAYNKMPFGLKNDGETFQRAMNFDFHGIKAIVEPYLTIYLQILIRGFNIQIIYSWYLRDADIIKSASIPTSVYSVSSQEYYSIHSL